ncbi:hypothetical protein GCM10010483_33670 [Actinokineospora diospyrosa]
MVVGRGPNGLVAANILADVGWDVLVLEATAEPSGAARTAELTVPDYRHDCATGSTRPQGHTMGRLLNDITRLLGEDADAHWSYELGNSGRLLIVVTGLRTTAPRSGRSGATMPQVAASGLRHQPFGGCGAKRV